MPSSSQRVNPPDAPAFPPDDNVKITSFIYRLAAIESQLIEQRELLAELNSEFQDFKGRYPDNSIAYNTKENLKTVEWAVRAIAAKVASIDNGRAVNSLLN